MTKVYQETEQGSYQIDGMCIPKADGNRHYRLMLSEVKAGEATIKKFNHTAKARADKIVAERTWRDAELARSDIELNKVQDGRGSGLVSDWRQYRNELRDWPNHFDFPEAHSRPVFTSTEG